MSANTEHRKLAAIMFTDMVGYSALAQRDEALALELLEEHHQILRGVLPAFQGTEIKSTGDGLLVEFSSALAAVQCGLEIQRSLAEHNEKLPDERWIQIRIGIHLGDVVRRGNDLLGDGVNIAARIEPLAEPGGICVTRAVFEQIENKVPQKFTLLSKPELKNISANVEVYKLVLHDPQLVAAAWKARQALFWVVVCIVVLNILLFLKFGLTHNRVRGTPAATNNPTPLSAGPVVPQKSIAVLPFVCMSADKSDEYLSDGMTEELLNVLSKVPGLRVPGRSSCFAFKGRNEEGIFRKVGEQLHVGTVLEGSVRKAGEKLRVTAQLIAVNDGFHLWSEDYDGDTKDILTFQSDVARRVVQALQLQLGVEQMRVLARPPTENIEAYKLYRQGRRYQAKLDEANFKKSLGYFHLALANDPLFALAYAGMADTYGLAGDTFVAPGEAFSKAKEAALKAIELDDALAEAHASLGFIHYHYDWDWEAAEMEFKRALALNPQSAQACTLYTEFLGGMGRFEDALNHGRQALEIDPLSPLAHLCLGRAFIYTGHSDDAIQLFSKALKLEPSDPWLHLFLGRAYLSKGREQRGREEMESAQRLEPNDPYVRSWLGYAHAVAGRRADALRALQKLDEMEKTRYVSRITRVFIYAGLGDKDKAFEWLEKAYQERSDSLAWFPRDPEMAPLHADPRYSALMRKVGFSEP